MIVVAFNGTTCCRWRQCYAKKNASLHLSFLRIHCVDACVCARVNVCIKYYQVVSGERQLGATMQRKLHARELIAKMLACSSSFSWISSQPFIMSCGVLRFYLIIFLIIISFFSHSLSNFKPNVAKINEFARKFCMKCYLKASMLAE